MIFALLAASSAAYCALALIAVLRWRGRAPRNESYLPPVSILKPVYGRDPRFFDAIRSHAAQDYPEYEILFGVRAGDAALGDVRRLAAECPRVRIVEVRGRMPNNKVAAMAELAAAARFDVLLVNDSDIVVEPGYLRTVVAPLADPQVGVVTALYRAGADSFPARWEALGIATDFAPSVLVARMVGVVEFALGSTMALRREDLDRIGGFAVLGDYLADDYQLGRHIAATGKSVFVSPAVVETRLGGETWGEVWRHQVRWARTIRVSRGGGYFGAVVTHATVWALAAAAAGWWKLALLTLALRLTMGLACASAVLHDPWPARLFYLLPVRDLWGFAVWLAGLAGRTVEWRGERLRLSPDGRIRPA